MKALNSPFLFLTLLLAFVAIAVCAHIRAIEVTVPHGEQSGFTPSELRQHADFVAFHIKADPVALYHPKTKREAALIAASIWNIEVTQ